MTEVRMSLKEAGKHLGLKPNSVRSRYKKGLIRGEPDNMGKIWVWVNPDEAANDRGSNRTLSKVTNEGYESNEIKALKDHLKATTEQLSKAEAEIADLKPQALEAVRLKAENDGLRDQQGRTDAEIKRLREAYTTMDTERQELIKELLNRKKGLWERIFG